MIREKIAAAALFAYPREARGDRGPEMLSMLLDASEGSPATFARETSSLVVGGVRERAAITAQVGTGRLIADACRLAAVIWLMFSAWIYLGLLQPHRPGGDGDLVATVLVWGVLACALVGHDRIAGILGICGIAMSTISFAMRAVNIAAETNGHFMNPALATHIGWYAVPLLCFVVMVWAPKRRPSDPRRLLWLAPIAVVGSLGLAAALTLGVVFVVYAVLLLPVDPRPALACGLCSGSVSLVLLAEHFLLIGGRYGPLVLVLIAVAPTILIVGVTRLGFMRRASVR